MRTDGCKIYVEPDEVELKLGVLGLELQDLNEVLRHISLTMASFTPDHPSWGPGITTASEAVASLRGVLKSRGWERKEENGFSLTVNTALNIAINIAKGDESTGVKTGSPVTVSEKGVCTQNAVDVNQLILDLFPLEAVEETEDLAQPTWYLLYSKRDKAMWCELSLPIGLSSTKRISNWSERIILPCMPDDGEFIPQADLEDRSIDFALSKKNE